MKRRFDSPKNLQKVCIEAIDRLFNPFYSRPLHTPKDKFLLSLQRLFPMSVIQVVPNFIHEPVYIVNLPDHSIEIYKKNKSRGGNHKPILLLKLDDLGLKVLEKMKSCSRFDPVTKYPCGNCLLCLEYKNNIFSSKMVEFISCKNHLVELREFCKTPISNYNNLRRNYRYLENKKNKRRIDKINFGKIKAKLTRYDEWRSDLIGYETKLKKRQSELRRVLGHDDIRPEFSVPAVPHYSVSISLPNDFPTKKYPIAGLLEIDEKYFKPIKIKSSSSFSQDILDSINFVNSFSDDECVRERILSLFRELIVKNIQALFPNHELSMFSKIHQYSKFSDVPNFHFLISSIAFPRGFDFSPFFDFEVSEIKIKKDDINNCYKNAIVTFIGTLKVLAKEWSLNRNHQACIKWKREISAVERKISKWNPNPDVVDVKEKNSIGEISKMLSYMNRESVSNISQFSWKPGLEKISLKYGRGEFVDKNWGTISIFELLRRLVGFDGRKKSVKMLRTGMYRSRVNQSARSFIIDGINDLQQEARIKNVRNIQKSHQLKKICMVLGNMIAQVNQKSNQQSGFFGAETSSDIFVDNFSKPDSLPPERVSLSGNS